MRSVTVRVDELRHLFNRAERVELVGMIVVLLDQNHMYNYRWTGDLQDNDIFALGTAWPNAKPV